MHIRLMVKKIFLQKCLSKLLISMIILITLLGLPVLPGAAMETQQEPGPTYIVQQGDTLNEIAIRFGLTPEEILTANAIDDPNALFIGQTIVIPGLEGITGVLTSQVLPLGASLTGLARQLRLNREDLVRLNRLTSPSEMIAGVSFIVPVREDQDQLTPIPTSMPETILLETAIRSGTSPWILVEDNQLSATWDLLSGETVYAHIDQEADDISIPENIIISVNRLPVVQGETLHIALSGLSSMEVGGSFNGESLHFFVENDGNYHSFSGIHALAEPGVYPLQVHAETQDGTLFSFDQLVLLSTGFYGTQMVYVGPEFLDDDVIDEEDAYIFPILDRFTTVRHWEGRFRYPVDEPCVNSPFGLRRIYNDGLLFFYHTGMDFAVCAPNLNIYAPAAGEVMLAEELDIRGKAVLIDHGWGVISGYWHLSEFNVSVGDFVQPGDLLGLIGNTGRSAGPHLHFEMLISGTPVNPQTWLDQTFP